MLSVHYMSHSLESVVYYLSRVKLQPTVENGVGNSCRLSKHRWLLPHFTERQEQIFAEVSLQNCANLDMRGDKGALLGIVWVWLPCLPHRQNRC